MIQELAVLLALTNGAGFKLVDSVEFVKGSCVGEEEFKRRGRHDIIMAILKSAKQGAKKTNIMFKARLSYTQLEKYLNHLETAGFIVEDSGVWKTTEKGLHVIEACRLCHRLVKEAS